MTDTAVAHARGMATTAHTGPLDKIGVPSIQHRQMVVDLGQLEPATRGRLRPGASLIRALSPAGRRLRSTLRDRGATRRLPCTTRPDPGGPVSRVIGRTEANVTTSCSTASRTMASTPSTRATSPDSSTVANVEPSATVTTRSNALSLARVRLPELRRMTISDR